MNSQSPIDISIDRLVLVRKVTSFANLGIYAGPRILDQAAVHLDELKSEHSEAGLKQSQAALNALRMNLLPSQSLCQASMAEIDSVLMPLRAQRRNERAVNVPRPRPN